MAETLEVVAMHEWIGGNEIFDSFHQKRSLIGFVASCDLAGVRTTTDMEKKDNHRID
jgi:hypothetical protein